MGYISGLCCDVKGCKNNLLYSAHAPGVKVLKGSHLPGKSDLNDYGRARGWSIGNEIMCPECRRKYGKPQTFSNIKHAHRYFNCKVYTMKDFLYSLANNTIEDGYGYPHDGFGELRDLKFDKTVDPLDISQIAPYVIWYKNS